MNYIDLAVIGVGLIGQRHLELIQSSAGCQVSAICDPNPAAAAIAEQYEVPFYQDYQALLQKYTPHGAIIATPTDLHTEVGIACAQSGVHILVEKPIAATVAEAHRLLEAADENQVHVLVGHHRRHNPLVQAAHTIVQSGQIGKLVAVSASFLLKKPDDYYDVEWRCLRPGGGPALINLIHDIDNLRYICGDVHKVFAQASSATRGLAVEDAVSINLSFANGALGSIIVADTTPAPWSYELTAGENPVYPHCSENCYHFSGTEGSLSFPQMALWRYADGVESGWHQPLQQSQVPTEAGEPLVAQVAHFCRVINGEEAPLVSGLEGTKSLEVVLAILESAETERPILL